MSDDQEQHEAGASEVETENAVEIEGAAEAADPEILERARLLGWKSPDDWKGDPPPRGFLSPEDYVEKFANTPREIEALKRRLEQQERDFLERARRQDAMNEAALERQRKQLQARMDGAVEMGDTDAYKAAKAEMAELDKRPAEPQQPRGVPAETQRWMASNPWYGQDRVMTAAAQAAADEAVSRGITDVAAQLDYVDQVVAQRFGGEKPKPKRNAAVDEGALQVPRKRSKGVSDLPAEAKRAGERFVKQGIYKTLDEYAKDYHGMG